MKTKENEKFVYKAKTKEILNCFIEEKIWCKLLLNHGKDYDSFLSQIIADDYIFLDGAKSIKDISVSFGLPANKVTKWIKDIYDDLIDLNMDHPLLFKSNGIQHDLIFSFLDSKAYFTVWLPQSPKIGERFMFHFIKASIGTEMFWVKDVDHYMVNGDYSVTIYLEGREPNAYREWLVDRALFTGVLHFMDIYKKKAYEIDKYLLGWYKR